MRFGDRVKACREEIGLSQEELAARMGYKNRSTIAKIESGANDVPQSKITNLAEALETTPARLMGWDVEGSFSLPENIVPITTMRIPVLGEIACGEPIYAQEEFECYAEVGTNIRCDFALWAKGDSMVGARIYDGDLIFIRKQDDVRDGEIAAVIIDDEATLKRVYKLPGGRIMLRAENPRFAPIEIGGDSEVRNVRIIGKAVAFQGDVR